jgi:hypothetical protein
MIVMINIQPVTNSLQKALTNDQIDIHKTILRPWNYTSEPLHDTMNRSVTLDENLNEKSSFSEIFDDFKKKQFIHEPTKKKYEKHVLSKDSYPRGGGGNIDQIIVNVKEDIKNVNEKIQKIRKQQMIHKKNEEYVTGQDLILLTSVNTILQEFKTLKL